MKKDLKFRTAALLSAALLAASGITGCGQQGSAAESAAAAGTGESVSEAPESAAQEGAEGAAEGEYWPVLPVSPGGAQFPDMNIVVPTTEAPPEYIRIGTRSWIVKDLQARLMELGFMDNDEPSEYYGEVTQAAVKIYQRQNHLAQDGIVGAETLAAILDENAHYYTAQHGDSGTDIVELQQRLYQLGYLANSSDITGTFDEKTLTAVQKFQQMNELEPDGKIGRQSQNLMYSEEVKPNLVAMGEKSTDPVYMEGMTRFSEALDTEILFYPGFHNLPYDLPREFAINVLGTLLLADC